jgi:hypothetical protein
MAVDTHRSDRERPEHSANPEGPQPSNGAAANRDDARRREPSGPGKRRDQRLAAGRRAETRFSRWQRKLLDLSLHNRLLNFKPTRRSLELFCPNPLILAEKLEAGARIQLVPKQQASDPRHSVQPRPERERAVADTDSRPAAKVLKPNELMVDLEPVELAARLVELYRTARTDLQEGGANTLFLVLGFLQWKRDDKGGRIFRAPLVLIPVALHRQSVRSGVRMVLHEDEARFNTTLLEMLRQDFGLEISGLDESLPSNERGSDIAGVWNRVRQEIAGIEGFEVIEDVVVGTFSFAKYLMWRDLVDRRHRILANRVVRRLAESPREPFRDFAEFPDPSRLDREYPPESLCTVLPADSSQLSAVAACAGQTDFVLIGPPGTGKSQTIANMIAHTLAGGRTVLFVSEKVAALEVVYKRLQEAGLGEFCLELHSNKAKKIEVLGQLREAWSMRESSVESEWHGEAHRLEESRRTLNEYVDRIHHRYRNGLTPFLALGQVISNLGQPFVGLSWGSAESHDERDLARLRDIARRMDVYAAETGGLSDNALYTVHQADWSPAWQKSLVEVAGRISESVSQTREKIAGFYGALRIGQRRLTLDQLRALKLLVTSLSQARGRDLGFAFERNVLNTVGRLNYGLGLLRKYRTLERRLARRCADSDIGHGDSTPSARWQDVRSSWWPESESDRRRIRNAMFACGGASGKNDYGQDLNLLWELQEIRKQLGELQPLAQKISAWRGVDTSVVPLEKDLHFVRRLLYAITTLGTDIQSLMEIHSALRKLITCENDLLASHAPVGALCAALRGELRNLENLLEEFSALTKVNAYECIRAASGESWLAALKRVTEGLVAKEPRLNAWCAWLRVRDEAVGAGLGSMVVAVENGEVTPGWISRCFDYSYCRWWVSEVVQADTVLREFHSADRNDRIQQFRGLDDSFTELSRRHIRTRLCARLPERNEAAPGSEFSLLRREMEKKSRHKALRQLIGEIPSALTRLTPCLLMSPLSVAQYLPAEQPIFDLVIFDEASQITVWDAVGAVARARKMIVVGDPRQLPPTSFFSRSDEEPEDGEDFESDLESILEECLGAGLAAHDLQWHYRSKHESLIAFSNHRYYGGGLITFPSPFTHDRAVRCRHVYGGVYGRGGTRTNRAEAKAVVDEVIKRLKSPSFDASNLSIGVVTFNIEQQRLIEDLLDEQRFEDPSIEHFFSEDRYESLFVKNLESVQGDERDLIFFSVTFGPDAEGYLSMNFGPLNRDGGERRLNVAITRARSELLVFTSLRSEQIDLSRAGGAGVRDFKHFLEFAERGPRALAESIYGSVGEYASSFEGAVARALSERGWVVHPQIGASAYRVGLGVVHPDTPGRYLAGLECDGETYRRSATARDREKLRDEALRKIGWEIVRVWSLDWWLDPKRAADNLDGILSSLLEQAREEAEAERMAMLRESLQRLAAESSAAHAASLGPATVEIENTGNSTERPTFSAAGEESVTTPVSTEFAVKKCYRICDPPVNTETLDSERFFDRSQEDAIRKMIDVVIAAEGPLREDLLVKRVVRGYGFKRTGRKLRDRVLDLTTSRYETTSDAGGVFFWPDHTAPERWTTFRAPVTEDDFRAATEICFEELVALARRTLSVGSEDPARDMARVMGLSRIDSSTRRRLEDVLSQAETRPSVDEMGKAEFRK